MFVYSSVNIKRHILLDRHIVTFYLLESELCLSTKLNFKNLHKNPQ